MPRRLLIAAFLLLSGSLFGYASLHAAENGPSATFFAAASLHDVLTDLAQQFEEQTGREIVLVFGASSTLARQIEAGAPADGYVSAHLDYAEQIAARQDDQLLDLFGNRLVLVASASATAITSLEELPNALGGRRLAVGDPAHVPAGIYAQQALEQLGLWEALADQLAPAADVRGALQFVEVGAAPFGLVYLTDARASDKPVAVRVDEDLHDPIRYWGVQTDPDNVTAELFFTYIVSFEGQVLIDWYGFDSVTSLD